METLRVVLLGVTLAAACLVDLRSRRVPNSLTFPAILSGIVLALIQSGLPGLGIAGAGLALASVALFGYALRLLGAGDVKLLWAIGALMGPRFIGATLVLTVLLGGLGSALWILMRRERRLPYAPAIAMGAAAALWLQQEGGPW